VQDAYNFYGPLNEVQARLDAKMTDVFHAMHEMAQAQHAHNRLAAYLVSVKRVAEAVATRGWVR
jgi:glutamate dehydrogenase/leucine dehydrogenase